MDYVRQLNENSSKRFRDGEKCIAAAELHPHGSYKKPSHSLIRSLMDALVTRKISQPAIRHNVITSSTLTKSFPKEPVVVAITNKHRVLVFALDLVTREPRGRLAKYDLGDMSASDLRHHDKRSVLTIKFSDGGEAAFDAPTSHELEQFANLL